MPNPIRTKIWSQLTPGHYVAHYGPLTAEVFRCPGGYILFFYAHNGHRGRIVHEVCYPSVCCTIERVLQHADALVVAEIASWVG